MVRGALSHMASSHEDPSSSRSKKLAEAEVSHATIDYSAIKGDNIELWAIRVPPGFDATQLDGLTLSSASGGAASGDGFELRTAPAAECGHVLAAFPSVKRKRWLLGKPFSRQLVVSIPPPPVSSAAQGTPPPLPPVAMASGLRLRSTFLGGTLPQRSTASAASAPRKRKSEANASGPQAEDAEAKAARKAARKAAKRAAR